MSEKMFDERVTELPKGGYVSVTLVAEKAIIPDDFPPVIVYGVVILVRLGDRLPETWTESFGSAIEAKRFMEGVKAGLALLGSPACLDLPVIDPVTGLPWPLPKSDDRRP